MQELSAELWTHNIPSSFQEDSQRNMSSFMLYVFNDTLIGE